ncbi:hypothetical protein [Rubritalea tangerina]|uniref:hypothetical protein n=1 Tax=Rubritalea tangerina TaxID=430798 RepID=UPI00361D5C78
MPKDRYCMRLLGREFATALRALATLGGVAVQGVLGTFRFGCCLLFHGHDYAAGLAGSKHYNIYKK